MWSGLVTNSPAGGYQGVGKHFAAMVDYNGDCFSDILMLSGNGTLEIYLKNNHNKYDYSTLKLSKNISWLSLADLDNNGATDIFLLSYS